MICTSTYTYHLNKLQAKGKGCFNVFILILKMMRRRRMSYISEGFNVNFIFSIINICAHVGSIIYAEGALLKSHKPTHIGYTSTHTNT